MKNAPLPENKNNKTIDWPENKIRWLIYYYLVGVVVSLYVMMFVEMTVKWPFSYLMGLIVIAGVLPISVSAFSVVCATHGWLKRWL
jgi:uncharacterized membrane protein